MNNSVEIELTTNCAIKCPACPRTYQHVFDWDKNRTWAVGHLDKNIVFNIFENEYYDSIRFVGCYGDCIYHPNFVEIMTKACTLDKRIRADTNGAYRRKEFWQELSELPWAKRKEFRFSIDGLEDTNHIYRKGSDWQSIMMAVDTLAGGKYKPKLIWQMLVFPYNEHQVDEARSLSKRIGFDEFHASKSLRKYNPKWFVNEQEGRNIDWNYA